MIQLYTDQSPHAWKVSVALEELGLPYRVHHVRMSHREQKRPEYLNIWECCRQICLPKKR